MTVTNTPSQGESAYGMPLSDRFKRPRLRREEASNYLLEMYGISFKPQTLAKFACTGGGPPFQKIGRIPLYPRVELDRWADDRLGNLKRSTSE